MRATTRVARCYLYQISRRRTAFGKPFVWWIREPLDVGAMREAAAAFVGMKDFDAFTADDPEEKSTRVLVDAVEIVEAGALILIRVQGSHFLWKMVRRMVGVLAAVGRGELSAVGCARRLDGRCSGGSAARRRWRPRPPVCSSKPSLQGRPGAGPIRPVMNIDAAARVRQDCSEATARSADSVGAEIGAEWSSTRAG